MQVPAPVQGDLVIELDCLPVKSAGKLAAGLVNKVGAIRQHLRDRGIVQDGQQAGEHAVIIR